MSLGVAAGPGPTGPEDGTGAHAASPSAINSQQSATRRLGNASPARVWRLNAQKS
jgi:hypothetical protein